MQKIIPTNEELFFGQEEIIVSKTDLKGRLIYVNDVFCRIAGYKESECLGQPHSMIRHPDMPRTVFKLLWDTIQDGREIFAYVKNMALNGDHYWVLAHVTPSFGTSGEIVGFHSNRRCPDRNAIRLIEPVYAQLLAEEKQQDDRKRSLVAGADLMNSFLQKQGMSYPEFIFSTVP